MSTSTEDAQRRLAAIKKKLAARKMGGDADVPLNNSMASSKPPLATPSTNNSTPSSTPPLTSKSNPVQNNSRVLPSRPSTAANPTQNNPPSTSSPVRYSDTRNDNQKSPRSPVRVRILGGSGKINVPPLPLSKVAAYQRGLVEAHSKAEIRALNPPSSTRSDTLTSADRLLCLSPRSDDLSSTSPSRQITDRSEHSPKPSNSPREIALNARRVLAKLNSKAAFETAAARRQTLASATKVNISTSPRDSKKVLTKIASTLPRTKTQLSLEQQKVLQERELERFTAQTSKRRILAAGEAELRRHEAAMKIQAVTRGFLCRLQLMQEYVMANIWANNIQKTWRGYRGRRIAAKVRTERAAKRRLVVVEEKKRLDREELLRKEQEKNMAVIQGQKMKEEEELLRKISVTDSKLKMESAAESGPETVKESRLDREELLRKEEEEERQRAEALNQEEEDLRRMSLMEDMNNRKKTEEERKQERIREIERKRIFDEAERRRIEEEFLQQEIENYKLAEKQRQAAAERAAREKDEEEARAMADHRRKEEEARYQLEIESKNRDDALNRKQRLQEKIKLRRSAHDDLNGHEVKGGASVSGSKLIEIDIAAAIAAQAKASALSAVSSIKLLDNHWHHKKEKRFGDAIAESGVLSLRDALVVDRQDKEEKKEETEMVDMEKVKTEDMGNEPLKVDTTGSENVDRAVDDVDDDSLSAGEEKESIAEPPANIVSTVIVPELSPKEKLFQAELRRIEEELQEMKKQEQLRRQRKQEISTRQASSVACPRSVENRNLKKQNRQEDARFGVDSFSIQLQYTKRDMDEVRQFLSGGANAVTENEIKLMTMSDISAQLAHCARMDIRNNFRRIEDEESGNPEPSCEELMSRYSGELTTYDLRHGTGTQISYDKRLYTGQWVMDEREGYGEEIFHDDDKSGRSLYKGNWDCNEKHGNGRMIWCDGSSYDGQWVKGKREGYGEEETSTGSYHGNWLKGKKHGQGLFVNKAGDSYDGEWLNGKKNFYGVMRWQNGCVYKGEWLDNKRYGVGVFTAAVTIDTKSNISGSKYMIGTSDSPESLFSRSIEYTYEGEWQNGLRHGRGTERRDGGHVSYEGFWENGLRHGRGVFTITTKDVLRTLLLRYEGDWREDMQSGFGVLTWKDDMLVNKREDDEPDHTDDYSNLNAEVILKRAKEHLDYSKLGDNNQNKTTDDIVGKGPTTLKTHRNLRTCAVPPPSNVLDVSVREPRENIVNEEEADVGENESIGQQSEDETTEALLQRAKKYSMASSLQWFDPDLIEELNMINNKNNRDVNHSTSVVSKSKCAADSTVRNEASATTFNIYEGEWLKNKAHGAGDMRYSNGDRYQGQWYHGLRHGVGTFTWGFDAKNIYEGGWEYGFRQGPGMEILIDGERYRGEFADDLRNGRGVCWYSTGDIYDGEWSDGTRCGSGMYRWCSLEAEEVRLDLKKSRIRTSFLEDNIGLVYVGLWERDSINGHGKITFNGNTQYEGSFFNGLKHGFGDNWYDNGDYYRGNFEKNLPCGVGRMVYANGDIYAGHWKDGRYHGAGEIIYANLSGSFEGIFSVGWRVRGLEKRHNSGIYIGRFTKDGYRLPQDAYFPPYLPSDKERNKVDISLAYSLSKVNYDKFTSENRFDEAEECMRQLSVVQALRDNTDDVKTRTSLAYWIETGGR